MAVTQKSYVDNSSSVKAARKKLNQAKAALADAQKAKAGLPANVGENVASQIDTRILSTQNAIKDATAEVSAIESKASNYFDKNQESIQSKATSKKSTINQSNIASAEEQILRMKELGLDTTNIEQQVAKAKEKKTNKESNDSLGTGAKNNQVKQKPDDFQGLIKDARSDIKKMSAAGRLDIANKLMSIGISVPKSGEFTDALVQGYTKLLNAAQGYYNLDKSFPTVESYIAEQQRQRAVIGAGGTGGTGGASNLPYGKIYDKTAAKAKVNEIVKSVLNREATKEEVASLSAQLIKAQKDNPYRTVNGRTLGGLDVNQFLTDIVQANPEYTAKKQAQQDSVAEDIKGTLRANGLPTDAAQVKTYADRVKNGEDIKTIQTQIRRVAGNGQPKNIQEMLADGSDLNTIYDPYRRMMATSLGITPDSITLDDPTLRMAIGPDKEMSLYDYKKAIRQDNRWKYSQEANDEVTNMINQVKRDFGFMG